MLNCYVIYYNCYVILHVAVNTGQFPCKLRRQSNMDVVPLRKDRYTRDRTCEQWEGLRETRDNKETYTYNQEKETAEILWENCLENLTLKGYIEEKREKTREKTKRNSKRSKLT